MLRLAILLALSGFSLACAAGAEKSRLVVVLYPEADDGSPGNTLSDQSIRATFAAGAKQHVEIHNEYLDVSRFPEPGYRKDLAAFLRRKYEGRKVDVVLAGLATALDYAHQYRAEIFPHAPLVFFAVDHQGIAARRLEPDCIGVPTQFDLAD